MFVLLTDIGVMVCQRFISYNIDGGHLVFVCKAILNGLFYIWTKIKTKIVYSLLNGTIRFLHQTNVVTKIKSVR